MSDSVLKSPALPSAAPAVELSYTIRLQKVGLNPTLVAGLVLLALVVLVALTAPLLTPYDPIAQSLGDAFQPPFSPEHVLGTDNFGRDMWSRIVYSTRLDLQIALVSVLFPFTFGSLVGIAAGYLGGRELVDEFLRCHGQKCTVGGSSRVPS
jgi:ABC-type dipeptide/oligopeptide/nickel transport system permease subunit